MTKGYWIAHVTVDDLDAYEAYRQAVGGVLARYGAEFLVRGGERIVAEGDARPRTVVIAFPSYADALACYESPEYKLAKALRDPVSTGDLVIIEGYDG